VSDLARALLDELAGDPVALERLRELVGNLRTDPSTDSPAPAYTVATLAMELGRTERSIRAAIARGELQAAKRGRGYVISADAVAAWARAPIGNRPATVRAYSSRRRRSGPGPATRALRKQVYR
jgi:excisionase family DNA binding protein